MPTTVKNQTTAVAAAVIAFVSAVFSPIFPIIAPVAAVSGAVMFLNAKSKLPSVLFCLLTVFVFGAVSFYLQDGIWYSLAVASFLIVPFAVLTVAFSVKAKVKTTILVFAASVGASLAAVFVGYVVSKTGSFSAESVASAFSWLTDGFEEYFNSLVENYKASGNTRFAESYTEIYKNLGEMMNDYYIPVFPALLFTVGTAIAVPSVLITKNHCNAETAAKMGFFSSFRAERILAIAEIVCFIAALLTDNGNFGLTVKNVSIIGLAYFAVNGLSQISYMMRIKHAKQGTRYLVYLGVIVVCFLLSSFDILAVYGIFEALLQSRNKLDMIVLANGGKTDGSDLPEIFEKLRRKAEERADRGGINGERQLRDKDRPAEKNDEDNKDGNDNEEDKK